MFASTGLFARSIIVAALVLLTAGCTSNISRIPIGAEGAPTSKTFDAPVDRVWSAAQAALASDATFKVLDKSSLIMVTEYKTVDSNEISIVGTVFLGKTYKNNYTVNFRAVGPSRTEVSVNVGLQAQQVGFFTREDDQPQVKSYLRKKLFDQISAKL